MKRSTVVAVGTALLALTGRGGHADTGEAAAPPPPVPPTTTPVTPTAERQVIRK